MNIHDMPYDTLKQHLHLPGAQQELEYRNRIRETVYYDPDTHSTYTK